MLDIIDWSAVSRLEEWARKRYILLVKELGSKEFTIDDVEKILERHNLRLENVSKLISAFRKEGLIEVREHPGDSRKNIYRFILSQLSAARIPQLKTVDRGSLIKLLKEGADLIRNAVDYRVLLLLLFYKTISDKWYYIVEKYRREHSLKEAYELANESYITLYNVMENKLYTWREVVRSTNMVAELANALVKISEMNDNLSDLRRLVEVLGLLGFINEENRHKLEDLIELFNQYDFSTVDYDVIGDAYQWILSYFAPTKAKEGEIYTPREVIKLMVRLLDIEDESTVLDPACGSGAMLIESYNYVREKLKNGEPNLMLIGQEINEVTAVIAKMNIFLHGIQDYKIYVGDSLVYPKFEQADYVMANPPWNQDGYDEEKLGQPGIRKIYTSLGINGFTPQNSADWAWIQLMLYYARRKVGIVLDSGALFRGGKEKEIRKAVVENDLIDTVILLPEKLFYNTSAPGVIIIFDKNKPENRKNKILFINASKEYGEHPEVRRLNILTEDNIAKIVRTYREYKDIKGFSKIVPIEDIRKNNYNLNVTLYVPPEEEEEEIDILKEYRELKELEKERQEIGKKIEVYIAQLGKMLSD